MNLDSHSTSSYTDAISSSSMNIDSSAICDEQQPFLPARRRKKRKNRQVEQPTTAQLMEMAMKEMSLEDNWLENCISVVRNCVASRSWCEGEAENLEIICLGLGSPSNSPEARLQLCFLLKLRDALGINPDRVSAYDPVFSENDNLLLDSYRIRRTSENMRGRHPLSNPTILYMPHCGLGLYESVLRANWTIERLSRMMLIGNCLRDYVENKPSRLFHAGNSCAHRFAEAAERATLGSYAPRATAFSNTALQHVAQLPSASAEWWDLPAQLPHIHDGEVL